MNSEDKNENILNQMTNNLSLNSTLAAAGAAAPGGALYYYLNKNGPKPYNITSFGSDKEYFISEFISNIWLLSDKLLSFLLIFSILFGWINGINSDADK